MEEYNEDTMQILNVTQLQMDFGDETLFRNVSFAMNEKDRLAIIGPNGHGKTTLLRILLKQLKQTKGEVVFSKGVTVGYLSQDVLTDLGRTVYEETESVFSDLIAQERALSEMERQLSSSPDNPTLMEEYGKKQAAFAERGGYEYPYLIPMMLSKFGFHKEDLNRAVGSFSGGERTKIAFVKLLLMKPKLLILDEPTNHLDLATIEWLETYLKAYEGALLFVSHDRYFIDALATRIVEIEGGTSSLYKGNYTFYVEEKKLRYEQQLNAYEAQQKEIARLKRFIEFYKPKPRFVSRAKDREKKLERMQKIDRPYSGKPQMKLHFSGEIYEGKEILRAEKLSVGYDAPLIRDITFSLFGKDRIAIMGSNGCGKTTLLEALVDRKHILEGSLTYVRCVNVGYIRQHQIDMNPDNTILQELLTEFSGMGEKAIYNHLGKFNFDYDDAQKKIGVLSGGEKMRVVLAKIILGDYQVLILDEPTNHLDMVTRQALTIALNEFQGSIIFVSHDRYFVDELATHILYIDRGTPYFIQGNFMDFKEQEARLLMLSDQLEESAKKEKKPAEEQKRPAGKRSPRKLEELISKTEEEIRKVKEAQFLEENYMDYQKSRELEKKLEELEAALAKLEEEYLA